MQTRHHSTLKERNKDMDTTQARENLDSTELLHTAHLQQAVSHLTRVDAKLAALIAKHNTELPLRLLSRPSETCFQALCKSIIFQQLSMKAASTIYSRFLFLCGVLPPSSAHTQALITPRKRKADERLEAASEPAVASSSSSSSSSSRKQQATEGRKTRRSGQRNKGPVDEDPVALLTTPKQQQPAVTAAAEHASTEGGGTGTDGQVIRPLEPSDVLGCSLEALRGCGLSGQKASYLTGIASAFAAADAAASRGEKALLQDSVLRALPERELTAALVQLKGVGQWTADMVCMFTLGKANVLPTGDLGVRKGMQALYALPSLPSPAKMLEITDKWQPWRSVGSWYLWKMADGGGLW